MSPPFVWTPSGTGVLSEWLYGWAGWQSLGAQILAIVLLLVQGFLVNMIAINNRLPNEINLFPGVFYVLVSCLLPDFLYLSPVLIGNTFILIAIIELFATYKNPACADKIFNAGFWIGVASLFYFPFIFCIIFLIVGLGILRAFNTRERLMSLTGLFMPYLLAGMYYYAKDGFDVFWKIQVSDNLSFLSFGGIESGWNTYVNIALFALMLIYVLVDSNAYFAKRNIQVQKKIGILYWVMASALVGLFFQKNLSFEHLLMLAPSLGIFLAFTFTGMKRQWAESVHFLLVLGALALQFIPWQL